MKKENNFNFVADYESASFTMDEINAIENDKKIDKMEMIVADVLDEAAIGTEYAESFDNLFDDDKFEEQWENRVAVQEFRSQWNSKMFDCF